MFPRTIELLVNDCDIIVGIIALEDCLGPYVLNGLIIFTGVLKLL